MTGHKTGRNNLPLGLDELPVSSGTVMLGRSFMISDNLDASAAIDVFSFPDMSKVSLNTPFKIRFTMMLGCLAGSMRLRVQMKEHCIEKNDIIITMDGAIGECMEISPDARLFMIAFSSDFNVLEAGIKPTPEILCRMLHYPLVRLGHSEMCRITNIYEMLKQRLSDNSFAASHELAVNCVRTIFCYISGHMIPSDTECTKPVTRNRKILDDFMNLVETHSRAQRSIEFYAGKLFISTKYLSRTISETSGRTARDWITMRVILEAKVMLKETNLTIQEISDMLSFPNQSFFGSFFKRHMGMSPSAYRNRL